VYEELECYIIAYILWNMITPVVTNSVSLRNTFLNFTFLFCVVIMIRLFWMKI